MRARVLSGARTVGGVQILLRSAGGALVLDFGVVGNPRIVRDTTLFNEFSPTRPGRELLDYLAAGMAPPIAGIYAAAALGAAGDDAIAHAHRVRSRPGVAPIDLTDCARAVFISHAHDDHLRLIEYLDARTPVLMSETGARFHDALVTAGVLPPAGARPVGLPASAPHAVGGLTSTAVAVDHDIPGASGIIVTDEVSGARVAYTGDWRRHGRRPDLMDVFALAAAGVDVLFTDASTTDHDPASLAAQIPEAQVAERAADVARETRGAVYIAFHQRNVERHRDLLRVAREVGRAVVVTGVTARLWRAWGWIDADAPLHVWAGEVREDDPPGTVVVEPRHVREDPGHWIGELPVRLLPLLLDTGAGVDDTYLMTNGHPYSPGSPHWAVLRTWVRELGLQWAEISSHGHALPEDLAWLVDRVRPGRVVPVHTNKPEDFPDVRAEVLSLHDGDELEL
jgi:hypothetical protein